MGLYNKYIFYKKNFAIYFQNKLHFKIFKLFFPKILLFFLGFLLDYKFFQSIIFYNNYVNFIFEIF